jgi:hypothetical protein
MSNVTTAFRDQFQDDLRHDYQQMGSRLKPFVNIDPLAAENGYYDYLGTVEAYEKTGRAEEVNPLEPNHTKRKCSMKDFLAPLYVDKFDQKRTQVDLVSGYRKSIASALGRKADARILEAALGTAYEGRDGSTAVPFLAAQSIAANYVESGSPAASNITLAKLRKTLGLLTGNEAIENDNFALVTVAYTNFQLQSLLKICEELKVDNLTTMALASGKPNVVFHGMNFIRVSNLIVKKTGNNRSCIAFTKDAINFCENGDIEVEINYIPNRTATLVNGMMTGDAARMREKGVVEILCDETVI